MSPHKIQFVVEPLVVKGDGVPDGDLITKYVNGKVKERMFVPFAKVRGLVKGTKSTGKEDGVIRGVTKKDKVVYVKVPDIQSTDKTVICGFNSFAGIHLFSVTTQNKCLEVTSIILLSVFIW